MPTSPPPNTGPSSTTWEWKTSRVRRRPQGQKARTPQAFRWVHRSPLAPREKVTLTVKYRGGEECWYEITARGATGRFVGVTALHDVIQEIAQGGAWTTEDAKYS